MERLYNGGLCLTGRQRAADRVRKLRRLATSPNPAEAARARERADELARKHGFTDAELTEPEPRAQAVVTGVVADEPWLVTIASEVARHHGCRALRGPKGEVAFEGTQAKDATSVYRGVTRNIIQACRERWGGVFGRADTLWPTWSQAFEDAAARAFVGDAPSTSAPMPASDHHSSDFLASLSRLAASAGTEVGHATRKTINR